MAEKVVDFDADNVEMSLINGALGVVIWPEGSDEYIVVYQDIPDPTFDMLDDHDDIGWTYEGHYG